MTLDTVDHEILLHRLENSVGLSRMVHRKFRSYLTGSEIFVSLDYFSEKTDITYGVPKCALLGPVLLVSIY